ncbi:MAG: RimK family alpha-L-glutamate ligase [Alphaproteobacteria bacterium]|nr:RimK family alpha-L-glutamate ligase [Alphaproteobacteria bacterium]NCQ66276.1 RimK family alpha-L-glutamate ligase [Alphaproteobacteria bacterium]NCT06624.1 RimK family alpha-L-glutamate ligase [Alphaproteobacteria bacterium]
MKGLILFSKREEDLSAEKDYSLVRLLAAGRKKGFKLEVATPNQIELVVTRDDRKSILIDDKQTQLPDFVLPRMGADTTYYGLAVIRQLEHMGTYVCNGSRAVEAVKDKLHMHQVLAYSSLPTPKTMLAKFPIDINIVKREIGFPLIIKNVSGTQGAGIYLCKDENSFMDVMELLYSNKPNANIIIQEFIEKSSGQDLRVFVLGGRVVGCMKRSSSSSFKANFSKGGKVEPFELSAEAEWLAIEAARLVNLDVAGIDLLFDENGFKICEANSAPGFHGLEKVTGPRIAEEILDYIKLRVG